MLTLRSALNETETSSLRGMRQVLGSSRTSGRQLVQTHLMHQRYVRSGGRRGPLGFPNSEVNFIGDLGSRDFRGGAITILGDKIIALAKQSVSIRFLGFKCVEESEHDELSPHDEPYFVITVDTGVGAPTVKKFGEFEGIDSGDEVGLAELLIQGIAPDPVAIRVVAYENDHGDPDETAKKIQDEAVKISQEVQKIASAAEAADGPGAGPAAAAGTVGGIIGGPLGALVAAGIVAALGLGDDFIGQTARVLFPRANDVGNPPVLGKFQDNDYNVMIPIDGDEEGKYELYFDVAVVLHKPDLPVEDA